MKSERDNSLLVMTGAPTVDESQGLDEPCVDSIDPNQGTTFKYHSSNHWVTYV